MANFLGSDQRLDVDVDQVAQPLQLIPKHRWLGIKIAQAPASQTVVSPGLAGEGGIQQTGDVAQVQPLEKEIHCVLQLLRIVRSSLSAAHTPSIHERGCST